jgi:hypothetical protein
VINDHSLELVVCNHMIVINIVLSHDLIDFLFSQIVTQLREGILQCASIDLLSALSVKFLEQGG